MIVDILRNIGAIGNINAAKKGDVDFLIRA